MVIRQRILPVLAAVLCLSAVQVAAQPIDTDAAFAFAAQQLTATHQWLGGPTAYVVYTKADGTWELTNAAGWTSGFLPQCLWAMYERTSDPQWRSMAEYRNAAIEPQKYTTTHHDLGFMLYDTFGYGYRLTGRTDYRDICLTAAVSLASRYNPVVGAIKSRDWQEPFPVLIDAMPNIELLFWSAANGGPTAHRDIAIQHALTTARYHVRADGSSYHIVDFNPVTGLPAARPGEDDPYRTDQGYADESTWARGHSWGMYGFAMCYRWTGDPRFLATAQAMSDWWCDHLPADGVPYWDFDAPVNASTPRDTSAAAVATSALLDLAGRLTGPDRRRYLDTAEATLRSLAGPGYLAAGTNDMAILLHGTYHKPANRGVDAGLIWGDAYFLEALIRYDALLAAMTGGDADRDGDVDLDDFIILKQNFGTGALWTEGDFDGDGDVDLDDFVVLKRNFGTGS